MPLIPGKLNNRIILGLMTFGYSEADGARITDLETFNKVLDVFQARGYNEVDTARMYCAKKQETFTREAGWKDRGLTLATKIDYPNNPGDNNREEVFKSVEQSLGDLGTDCVDVRTALNWNDSETNMSEDPLRPPSRPWNTFRRDV